MAARRSGPRHLMLAGPQARVLQTAFRSVRTARRHTLTARGTPRRMLSVTDPLLCEMTVDPAGAAAHVGYAGQAYYFCSDGCARQFAADPLAVLTEATDPVCGMPVRVLDAQFTAQRGGARYVFCGSGCRDHFAVGAAEPAGRHCARREAAAMPPAEAADAVRLRLPSDGPASVRPARPPASFTVAEPEVDAPRAAGRSCRRLAVSSCSRAADPPCPRRPRWPPNG